MALPPRCHTYPQTQPRITLHANQHIVNKCSSTGYNLPVSVSANSKTSQKQWNEQYLY